MGFLGMAVDWGSQRRLAAKSLIFNAIGVAINAPGSLSDLGARDEGKRIRGPLCARLRRIAQLFDEKERAKEPKAAFPQ